MYWIYAIIVIAIIIILSKLIDIIPNKQGEKNIESNAGKFEKTTLLTANEKQKFTSIKYVTDKLRLQLYAKVRLADIVTPKEDLKNWYAYFNKVKSKHVDFLICNNFFEPICVIEIDDVSHDKNDRKQRDKLVNFILNDVGIGVIHKRGQIITSELEKEIRAYIV